MTLDGPRCQDGSFQPLHPRARTCESLRRQGRVLGLFNSPAIRRVGACSRARGCWLRFLRRWGWGGARYVRATPPGPAPSCRRSRPAPVRPMATYSQSPRRVVPGWAPETAERPGSPAPGQWCPIVNRDAIPAFGAAGWFGLVIIVRCSAAAASSSIAQGWTRPDRTALPRSGAGPRRERNPDSGRRCRVGARVAPGAPHRPVREVFPHTVRQHPPQGE
jgi:hypothetical protein